MQKIEDEEWVIVEPSEEFNEQYAVYNHALIGQALLLSKLEETTEVCAGVEIDVK